MSDVILCSIDRPDNQVLELRYADGEFATRRLEVFSMVEVTPEEAREWYEIARQVGGCVCRPFPRECEGRVA